MIKILQGVDIVEIGKFRKVFRKSDAFVSEIFTTAERRYCESKKDPLLHFAGRFASKEATLKALGVGLTGTGIDKTFQEIEVVTGPSGKPSLSLTGWAGKISQKKKIDQHTISISHSGNYAVSTVILIGSDNR